MQPCAGVERAPVMELKPFGTQDCIMCGLQAAAAETVPRFQFCEVACRPDGHGGFIDARTAGQAPTPHMHRTCIRCGYTWLTETVGDGDGALPMPTQNQAALAIVKTVAQELIDAATALEEAAHTLKEKGFPPEASRTRQAALKAKEAASGLVKR